jgi:hypothetical protein
MPRSSRIFLVACFGGGVGVADAIEDAGELDPAEEIVGGVLVGFVAVALDADSVEFEACGFVVAAAKLDDVVAEDAEGAEFAGELLGIVAVPCGELGGVAPDEDGGEVIGEGAIGGGGEFGGVRGKLGGAVDGVLMGEPLWVAALFPLIEVLLCDGMAVVIAVKDGADFGEGVEPLDETTAFFAVTETAIELGADFAREAGDFTGAGHGILDFGMRNAECGMRIRTTGVCADWLGCGIGGRIRWMMIAEVSDVRGLAKEEDHGMLDFGSFEVWECIFERRFDALECG